MTGYVGIDLHRRRSLVVCLGEEGERRWWRRIDNSPLALAEVIGEAGSAPEVVIEATWGGTGQRMWLPRPAAGYLGCARAEGAEPLPPKKPRRTGWVVAWSVAGLVVVAIGIVVIVAGFKVVNIPALSVGIAVLAVGVIGVNLVERPSKAGYANWWRAIQFR